MVVFTNTSLELYLVTIHHHEFNFKQPHNNLFISHYQRGEDNLLPFILMSLVRNC